MVLSHADFENMAVRSTSSVTLERDSGMQVERFQQQESKPEPLNDDIALRNLVSRRRTRNLRAGVEAGEFFMRHHVGPFACHPYYFYLVGLIINATWQRYS